MRILISQALSSIGLEKWFSLLVLFFCVDTGLILVSAPIEIVLTLLIITAVLSLAIIYSFVRDMVGVSAYAQSLKTNENADWESYVTGFLYGLHEPLHDVFALYQRQLEWREDQLQAMAFSSAELARTARLLSYASLHQSAMTHSSATAVGELSFSLETIRRRLQFAHDKAVDLRHSCLQNATCVADVNYDSVQLIALSKKIKDYTDTVNEQLDAVKKVAQTLYQYAEDGETLALTLSIEAAKESELGRAFAVLANEMRELTTKSQQDALHLATTITKANANLQHLSLSIDTLLRRITRVKESTDVANTNLMSTSTKAKEIFLLLDSIFNATADQQGAALKLSEYIQRAEDYTKSNTEQASQTAEIAEHLHKLTVAEL